MTRRVVVLIALLENPTLLKVLPFHRVKIAKQDSLALLVRCVKIVKQDSPALREIYASIALREPSLVQQVPCVLTAQAESQVQKAAPTATPAQVDATYKIKLLQTD